MKMSTRWANFSTPLMVSIDKMYVCGSVWVQHPCKMHAHVTEWAPPHHVSESLTCKNMIVCVCAGERVRHQVGGGGTAGVACWRGWMNVNISFTLLSQRLGWFICLRCLCHFACLTRTPTTPTDGSFGAPPPARLWMHLCAAHGHRWNRSSRWARGSAQACAEHKCAFINTSGHPPFLSTIVFFIEIKQVVFFKNKCVKTSMEIRSHAALAHYKWFLSAGGYLLAPVTCCFLPQTAS